MASTRSGAMRFTHLYAWLETRSAAAYQRTRARAERHFAALAPGNLGFDDAVASIEDHDAHLFLLSVVYGCIHLLYTNIYGFLIFSRGEQ